MNGRSLVAMDRKIRLGFGKPFTASGGGGRDSSLIWVQLQRERILLNQVVMPSHKEAVLETSGVLECISTAASVVVRDLHSGRSAGRDEIHPEMFKPLNVAAVTWLMCLFSAAWHVCIITSD